MKAVPPVKELEKAQQKKVCTIFFLIDKKEVY